MNIELQFSTFSLVAVLENTETGNIIYDSLPIETPVSTWGKELYFEIPEYIDLEPGAKAEVDEGALAYWPTGRCFCVFWGPTPLSSGKKPVAASAVNVFGKIDGDLHLLDSVKNGELVKIIKQ